MHARIVVEPMCGNPRAAALREHGDVDVDHPGEERVRRGSTPTTGALMTGALTAGGVR